MTVALYDEVVTVAPVRKLRVVRDETTIVPPAPKVARRGQDVQDQPFGVGDPLVNGAARLLTVPLRHLYAALWRAGVLEVEA